MKLKVKNYLSLLSRRIPFLLRLGTSFSGVRSYIPIFCLALSVSCLSCVSWGKGVSKAMYVEMEDLHVPEHVSYSGSPFGNLVEKTFSDERNIGFQEPRENRARHTPHYVYVLDIGDDALLARIHLIRSAQKAIYLQTFIWTDDESGRYVAYELVQAAKRGVKVKIIIDLWKSAGPPALMAYLASAHLNIEVKLYNPSALLIKPSVLRMIPELALRFKQVNQRMHNKVFIVDDRMGIIGGRNYENDYYDRGEKRNFKDRDVLVVGPVVRDMTDSFSQYWAFKLSVPGRDLIDVGRLIETRNGFEQFDSKEGLQLHGLFDDMDHLADDREYIQKKFVDKAFRVGRVKFVADRPGKNDSAGLTGGGIATDELFRMLSHAQKDIVMQTPYLVLDRTLLRGIKKLRGRRQGLDILISSNSLASTDHVHAYAFAYKQKKLFVKYLRFRIFEFKPVPRDIVAMMPRYGLIKTVEPADTKNNGQGGSLSVFSDGNRMESQERHLCLHAKSFVVDDKMVWIGSFNLDPRSAHLNTEVGLIIDDEAVARAVKENILRDMAPQNSWTIGKYKNVPVISLFSGLLANALRLVPIIDIWPFRYTTCFELKEGKDVVPYYHKNFYDNYETVGSFPDVRFNLRDIETMLLKAFLGIAEPII